MPPTVLSAARSLLMVIDLQERLLPAIERREQVESRAVLLIRAAARLGVPIVWTEQYPQGLGPTVAAVAAALREPDVTAEGPLVKTAFGCFEDAAIAAAGERLRAAGRDQLVLCGIETHVCILQTALQAVARGWTVALAEDACGSRRASDAESASRRLAQAGVVPASAEMIVMEWLGCAGGDAFRALLPLLKECR